MWLSLFIMHQIIKEKRAVVLPEPTLTERFGTMKASTTKVNRVMVMTTRTEIFLRGCRCLPSL